MSFSTKLIITILICGLCGWLLRVIPFIILKKFNMPTILAEFLQFVPIVIMTTLWFSGLFTAKQGSLPQINWEYVGATVPAFIAAIWTKDLLWIVLAGVIGLALIRLVF